MITYQQFLERKKLREFTDNEGTLFETLRNDDAIFDGYFGQNLISIVNPGVIKGLHFHNKTVEYTACIFGNILYVAIDENEGKPIVDRIEMGERNRIMIKTPPGIWHGFTTLYDKPAIVLYTMNRSYNPSDTDIFDKNPYSFGDVWTP
jgi:dTDP-4-dehydrorhamnose 3,5-epimerase